MTDRIEESTLRIARPLYELVRDEILPGTGLTPSQFWRVFAELVDTLGPVNRSLLATRERLQRDIDAWHRAHPGGHRDRMAYRQFLTSIGYLVADSGDCRIQTVGVDPEIGTVAGPQLVVPVDNARYALNAANARWGSLYDALYGTDAVPERAGSERTDAYNPVRGAAVIEAATAFLDSALPLRDARHAEVTGYTLADGAGGKSLEIELRTGTRTELADAARLVGYREHNGELGLLFRHHGLHLELQIDRRHPIGQAHPAGVKDVLLEAALTTIQDCEDSVAAVDAEDKTRVYRSWLGLMKGTLEAQVDKGGRLVTRQLNPDRRYRTPDGGELVLPGRSLMLVRNVGLHMMTDVVLTAAGEPVAEGMLDALVTSLIARHDLDGRGRYRNSRAGSIYIVKPKLHGPDEVAFTVTLFQKIEEQLKLPHNTLKLGIMDEERRTSANLGGCIRAARERLIFINTGFLDRTGDEIHTSLLAGPMVRKYAMRNQPWMTAYENRNVETGLACGLPGRAQIGKGMWAKPDRMADMLAEKIEHPNAGANTAWVPSPTAATLHAMHYHQVDVAARQAELSGREPTEVDQLLIIPVLAEGEQPTRAAIQEELDNNAQGILGYVVRWIDQGIGCSKVPDIHHVGLMEDRATLRISSQHIANWLYHGVVSRTQVEDTFRRMAALVDRQNADDPAYRPMTPACDGTAFRTALELVLRGHEQANGYTEALLHAGRRQRKAGAP